MALFVLVFRLVVGDGGHAARAPVHDALAAVDHVVMVPVAEDLAHGLGVLRRHGELLVVEIDGATHALDLLDDDSAVFLAPLLALLEELLAADLQARDALGLELLVDLGLCGDARMVGAQDPARRIAAHARVADIGVLDRVVERVPHMQHARDVWRRDDDRAVALALRAGIVLAVEPLVEHLLLNQRRIVVLGHL